MTAVLKQGILAKAEAKVTNRRFLWPCIYDRVNKNRTAAISIRNTVTTPLARVGGCTSLMNA